MFNFSVSIQNVYSLDICAIMSRNFKPQFYNLFSSQIEFSQMIRNSCAIIHNIISKKIMKSKIARNLIYGSKPTIDICIKKLRFGRVAGFSKDPLTRRGMGNFEKSYSPPFKSSYPL